MKITTHILQALKTNNSATYSVAAREIPAARREAQNFGFSVPEAHEFWWILRPNRLDSKTVRLVGIAYRIDKDWNYLMSSHEIDIKK